MTIKTKDDFDFIVEKIKVLVERYENNVKHHNQYQFYLANGEKLNFEVFPQSIPHLLGISMDYLKATNLFKTKDYSVLLKEFLNSSSLIHQQVQKGCLRYESLFSPFVLDKIESFENSIYYFSPDDIEFVCKYERSKTYQLGLEKDYFCDYFIAKRDQENNLTFLGLIKQAIFINQ